MQAILKSKYCWCLLTHKEIKSCGCHRIFFAKVKEMIMECAMLKMLKKLLGSQFILKGKLTARVCFLRIIELYVLVHKIALKQNIHFNSLFKFHFKIKFYSFSYFAVNTRIFSSCCRNVTSRSHFDSYQVFYQNNMQ